MATVDKTNELLDRVRNEFVGYQIEQPTVTYQDNTTTINTPLGTVRTGNQIKARGSCKVVALTGNSGAFKLKIDDEDGSQYWKTYPTMVMDFHYESQTHGERWIWPGGVFSENVWDDIHPKGSIRAIVTMQPQHNGKLHLEITVDPDHDDDPGHFIRDRVAPGLINRLDWILENMTNTAVDT